MRREGKRRRVTMIEPNSSHAATSWTEYFPRLDHMQYTYTHSMVSTQLTTSHKDRLLFIFASQVVCTKNKLIIIPTSPTHNCSFHLQRWFDAVHHKSHTEEENESMADSNEVSPTSSYVITRNGVGPVCVCVCSVLLQIIIKKELCSLFDYAEKKIIRHLTFSSAILLSR